MKMSWRYTLTGKPFTAEDREHEEARASLRDFHTKWDPVVASIKHGEPELVVKLACPECGGGLMVYIGDTVGTIGRRLIAKCEVCNQGPNMNIGEDQPLCVESLGNEFKTDPG
jgi:hypothetical protein